MTLEIRYTNEVKHTPWYQIIFQWNIIASYLPSLLDIYVSGVDYLIDILRSKMLSLTTKKGLWCTRAMLHHIGLGVLLTNHVCNQHNHTEILLIYSIWKSHDQNCTNPLLLKSHQILNAMMSHTSQLSLWKSLSMPLVQMTVVFWSSTNDRFT